MLKTHKIVLKSIQSEDLPLLFEWINEREQIINNSSYKPVSAVEHQEWFHAIQQRKDMFIFGIYSLESKKLIGSCQLHSIQTVHRNAELQIRIGDVQERGRSYGTDALKLLLDFAFKDLNLHRVYLHVFSSNDTALHVYKKLGFTHEGTLRQSAFINGNYVDVFVMGLLQSEFLQYSRSS